MAYHVLSDEMEEQHCHLRRTIFREGHNWLYEWLKTASPDEIAFLLKRETKGGKLKFTLSLVQELALVLPRSQFFVPSALELIKKEIIRTTPVMPNGDMTHDRECLEQILKIPDKPSLTIVHELAFIQVHFHTQIIRAVYKLLLAHHGSKSKAEKHLKQVFKELNHPRLKKNTVVDRDGVTQPWVDAILLIGETGIRPGWRNS